MEPKHVELLAIYRDKFVETVDVDKLIPILKLTEVLSSQDVDEICSQDSPMAKTETLLDILPNKGNVVFTNFCRALESTYPHLLTSMFLGGSQKLSDSTISVSKSDSEPEMNLKRGEELSLQDSSPPSPLFGCELCSLTPSKCNLHTNVTRLKAELQVVSHDRDMLHKELRKVHAERDFLIQNLAMSSTDPITRLGTLTKQHGASSSDKSLSASRDYDWLKSQCESAMGELQSLRRQHTETVRRCDAAVRESDFYRTKHRQVVTKAEKQAHETQTLRQQLKETLAEKRRLEEDVVALQAVDGASGDMHRHHRGKTKGDGGRSEAINQMYSALVDKYDDLRAEYDELHKRYSEVVAVRTAEVDEDGVSEIRKRYEDLMEERNNLTRERNGLSQQCTAAIHKWDTTLRELTLVKEALAKVQQQRDEAMKEINQAMAVRMKATKDLARLTEERNAAVQEYSLVMLERDSVHKEIEKLQEELTEANRRAEGFDKEKKISLEEVETLRREISSSLYDRDRALKECNDLREKYGDYVTGRDDGSDDMSRGSRDYDTYNRRDSTRKHRMESSLNRQDALVGGGGDTPVKNLAKTATEKALDNLDQANQELERLRKQLEKLQDELTEAQQEAEVCKRRRDWAFNERDKIVLERESIRTLCDKLRRERDRAVSDLAEALRDSDDIKKQRNEASKELKELREKMEMQMEKESRVKQLNNISHNHSHDSAIDADLQEWEMETLTVDLGGGLSPEELGFEVGGGKDDPQFPESGIFVTAVTKGGAADGKLKVNDTILQINNVDVTNCIRSKALDLVHNGGGVANMVVRRRRSSRFVHSVHLNPGGGKDAGLGVEMGLFISRITQGSAAAKEGTLAVGDRIININGKAMDGSVSPSEAAHLLGSGNDAVVVAVAKCSTPSSGAGSSSSSGHNIVENVDGDREDSPRLHSGSTSPVKEMSPRIRESPKKVTTSSSQTDDLHSRVPPPVQMAPSTFLDRAYHKIFRERRSAKSEKKSASLSNSSPSPVHEDEAIAQLDSIIEHFKKNTNTTNNASLLSKTSKVRRRKVKEPEKNNGGTWPRYRASPPIEYVEESTPGAIFKKRQKERKSIASLMNSPGMKTLRPEVGSPNGYSSRNEFGGNREPSPTIPTTYSSLSRPPKAPVVIPELKMAPYLSSPSQQASGNMVSSSSSMHHSTASSLDSPLDYSVVSANKDVLEYYHRNKKVRPKSSHYPQSDNESFGVVESSDSPVPGCQKDSYGKQPPLHMSSGSLSSGMSLLSPKTERGGGSGSPHLSDRLERQPLRRGKTSASPISSSVSSSISSTHSPFLRSPPNSLAYFPVTSGRLPHAAHPSHAHPHAASASQSGESLMGMSIPEVTAALATVRHYHRLEGRYSVSPSAHAYAHSPSQSVELHHHHLSASKVMIGRHSHLPYGGEELGGYGSYDGPSTFPKRVSQRSRLPSNQSVTSKSSGGQVSSSSIEKASNCSSPLPSIHLGVANPSAGTVASSMPDFRNKKLISGALRSIFIEKSAEPLGIQIDCGPHGGIFVSSVSENSLAAQAGLQIGDQLLEVCGINMRSATYLLAANVLRQCGDSITMLVQYSPDKYKEALETTTSSTSNSSSTSSDDGSPAPTPTPSSSPKSPKNEENDASDVSENVSPTATLTRQPKCSGKSSVDNQSIGSGGVVCQEPRRVFLKKATSNLGVSLQGGNSVGIFVHAVQTDSPASGANGLRCGDQILEYNGVDLRAATAEQAASELAKPAEMISILAQYSYTRYLEIQDQPGDSFYIRAMFDRTAESPEELSFRKDDILYVDNTMLNGVSGMWRAWLVNDDGQKRKWGIIPSKYKVDEELLMKRSLGELDSDSGSRRGSTSARRSFFRRKKHQQSNSRDSKELASYSDVSINSYSDSGTSIEDPSIPSYIRVERLDYLVLRPVLILGPLIEAVVDKLVQEFPHKFQRCLPEPVRGTAQMVEKGIQENTFVEYKRRGSHFECLTIAAVKEICDTNTHCIIDVSPQSVERLHHHQIYPIILFIKFKSTKQIREVKDSTFLTEKVSTKAAKEMYEHSLKIENEYKHLISTVIPGGGLAYMCAQIEALVDQEQSKTLWVRAAGTI